jgi:hypothetical protein
MPESVTSRPKKEKAPIEDPDLVGTGIGARNAGLQKEKRPRETRDALFYIGYYITK